MRLLVQFPTRNRPDQFLRILHRYQTGLANIEEVTFHISCDEDDKSMRRADVIQTLALYPNVITSFNNNNSKVQAINRGIEQFAFDVLLLASDDMVPEVWGYDKVISNAMSRYFPDTDGVLWFNDGAVGNRLNTLSILGRKYFDQMGYIYHPSYKSLWCDQEFTDVSRLLGKVRYFKQVIIRHKHPVHGHGVADSLLLRNESYFESDAMTYFSRRQHTFSLTRNENSWRLNSSQQERQATVVQPNRFLKAQYHAHIAKHENIGFGAKRASARWLQAYDAYLYHATHSENKIESWYSKYQLGVILERLAATPRQIIRAYSIAYKLRPDRVEPLFRIVRLLRKMNRYNFAYKLLRRVINSDMSKVDDFMIEPEIYLYKLRVEYVVLSIRLNYPLDSIDLVKSHATWAMPRYAQRAFSRYGAIATSMVAKTKGC